MRIINKTPFRTADLAKIIHAARAYVIASEGKFKTWGPVNVQLLLPGAGITGAGAKAGNVLRLSLHADEKQRTISPIVCLARAVWLLSWWGAAQADIHEGDVHRVARDEMLAISILENAGIDPNVPIGLQREPKAPPTKDQLLVKELASVSRRIAVWASKQKRATTALKKLNAQLSYLQRQLRAERA